MTDLFQKLQVLKVAGQELPCIRFEVSYQSRLAVHETSYRNAGYVDSLGLGNKVYTYAIPFRDNVNKRKYPNLATQGLETFKRNTANPEGFELVDPVDGTLKVKLQTFTRSGDSAGGRDGFDVQVSFIEAPEVATTSAQTINLKDTASKVNAGLAALPDSMPEIKKLHLDEQITVVLSQAILYKNLVINKIQAEIAKVTKILDLLDELFLVQPILQTTFQPLYYFCNVYLRDSNKILDKQVLTIRKIRLYITKASHNLIALASILSNEPQEILELNKGRIRKALDIPRGTQVYYYEA